eukprot:g12679.t1
MRSATETATRFSGTDYVDLTCKVDYSILDGPGAHLTNGIFLGDTVARETFVTQFVQDISSAANISPSRVFVMEIAPGWVHHDWEANNVIVLFRLVDNVVAGTSAEDGAVTVMKELTMQAQQSGSPLYGGLVTDRIDPAWGVVAVSLDVSLRLTTAIEVIGGDDVREGYYLNQGSQGWCESGRSASDPTITESDYCQWETWFVADVSGCLELLDPERVRVLFVKRAAADAVLVHFRIGEPQNYATEITVDEAAAELLVQIRNTSSALFAGNVTVAVDPTWGLSGEEGVPREYSPHLPHQVYDDHHDDDYERCKDVHRCNRAWVHYDGNYRRVKYTTQARGLRDFSGLVLDEQRKARELARLDIQAAQLNHKLAWIMETRETATLDASRRSRQDAAAAADELADFTQSACPISDGTTLAEETYGDHTYEWWADFNGSIAPVYLGPEIAIEVTGQRPLAILSRGSLILNTSIIAEPSTLGGFPGGGGIARDPGTDRLLSTPSVPPEYDLSSLVGGTLEGVGSGGADVASYNINGPGSASYRYFLFTITTSADDVDEVQRICTTADEGQTLRGCFHISHGNFSTECVPHDATPSALQSLIEGGLNAEPVDGPGPLPYPRSWDGGGGVEGSSPWVPGVGRVNVTTDGFVDDVGGRCWNITFSSAVGAVGPLTISTPSSPSSSSSSPSTSTSTAVGSSRDGNRLTGLGAAVSVETLKAGNTISGNFSIKFTGDGDDDHAAEQEAEGTATTHETAQLPATASATTVSEALLELPGVAFARTTRSVPAEAVSAAACSDGLCRVGPTPGGGLEWIVELGTRVGVAEPSSPTVAVGTWAGDGGTAAEGSFGWPEVDGGQLEGEGATVSLRRGWAGAAEQLAASFNASQPFSIALGGAGASHGGTGGFGADQSPASGVPREPYSSSSVPDLVGGSGGARSGLSPAAVNALGFSETASDSSRLVRGLGGAGGGAIELLALNDLTIGVMGSVAVDGGDGGEDWDGGGGGGSGGTVVVAAGGTVKHAGAISARGGHGGRTLRPLSKNGGGGGAGGRVVLYGQSVEVVGGSVDEEEEEGAIKKGVVDVGGGSCFVTTKTGDLRDDACGDGRAGGEGSFKISAAVGYTFGIDDGSGLGGAGAQVGQPFQAFRPYDGPEYYLPRDDGGGGAAASTPERVTFYVKVAAPAPGSSSESSSETPSEHASTAEWGAVFALIGPGGNASSFSYNASDWAQTPILYNSSDSSSGSSNSSTAGSFPAPSTTLIGVSISGGVMKHGTGYRSVPRDPGEDESAASGTRGLLEDRVQGARWYKVDIMIRWDDDSGTAGEYDVLVDGVSKAEDQRFGIGSYTNSSSAGGGSDSDLASEGAGGVERVGLYVLGEGRVWFDEIYLGPDFTMGFRCPESTRRGVDTRNAGRLNRWESLVEVGQSKNKVMQRHENFLSNQEKYLINHGGLVPFDGDGMREYLVDEYVRDSSDPPLLEGLRAGSLLEVPRGEDFIGKRALREGSARNLHGDGLWSSDASSSGSGSSQHPGGTHYWYGEHETNLSRPSASEYWGNGDEFAGWTGGVGACSTDDFVDWRFEGVMLHYANVTDMVLGREPEGGMVLQQPKTLRLESTSPSNSTESVDEGSDSSGTSTGSPESQVTYVMWAGTDGRGYLARTYYTEIEYVLPGAVMQPLWSSVKRQDGSVDFGLSYHRAFYSPDYDDYHDIYIQRWRMEDLPWEVKCVDRITGESRDIPYGEFNEDRGYCNQPEEYKVVLGQGYPVVRSRFQDPDDLNNSYWSPESVPSVKAQSWAANYRDGLCGIRVMGEGIDEDDPGLSERSPANRSACSNIADNPVHETLPDKLIGKKTVVETRLAKYVAVSLLTRDLLDTSAVLTSFEGELQGQDDLLTLVSGSGYDMFDWSAGADIGSTFQPQVSGDYDTAPDVLRRFHQYEVSENDRARYSLACQLDGTCPVNFRDEITVGHA